MSKVNLLEKNRQRYTVLMGGIQMMMDQTDIIIDEDFLNGLPTDESRESAAQLEELAVSTSKLIAETLVGIAEDRFTNEEASKALKGFTDTGVNVFTGMSILLRISPEGKEGEALLKDYEEGKL